MQTWWRRGNAGAIINHPWSQTLNITPKPRGGAQVLQRKSTDGAQAGQLVTEIYRISISKTPA